ncbi:MAG: DUF4058 family protein [Planctomycetes bacterium]|nr:DUF4058 family protein [Planctomycetota bacterium]
MPLRDHFRSPVDDLHSWDELHGGWPMMIVRRLNEVLPEPYFAAPGVHLGTLYEVDVRTYQDQPDGSRRVDEGNGGVAVVAYAPPKPTLTLEPKLPSQDVYEVRIYDRRRNRRLLAAIELVSPSNKDRPETRSTFIAKAAALLKHDVCVAIVDVVTTKRFNLYAELMRFLESADPALGNNPSPIYASSLRMRYADGRRVMDTWYYPLAIGQPLPPLPIWLKETLAISLDLESAYEDTCRTLRIR